MTEALEALPAAENPFGGILPQADGLDADPERFESRLRHSLHVWRDGGYRVVWLEVPIERAALIPVAVAAGVIEGIARTLGTADQALLGRTPTTWRALPSTKQLAS